MRTFVGCALVLGLAVSVTAVAQEKGKIDGKLLVGKWMPKDTKKGDAPMTLELLKDGKLIIATESEPGKMQKVDGTYTLDGDKLEVKVSYDGKEKADSLTIKKLTDTELETVDSTSKVDTFTRVKDDKKPDEKKAEVKKPDEKKKSDEKKPADKKPEEKKVEAKKVEAKKAEVKKPDEKKKP